jgi:hypothetical protein
MASTLQVGLPLRLALTLHLQSDWGGPSPPSPRGYQLSLAQGSEGGSQGPSLPFPSPALSAGVAVLVRGQGHKRGPPPCLCPLGLVAAHPTKRGLSPMLGCRPAACLHGRRVSLGRGLGGWFLSQCPPIFSPIYFNKINLTKERDCHWLYLNSEPSSLSHCAIALAQVNVDSWL